MPAAAFARPDRDQSEEARKERSSEDRPQQAERAVRADRPVRVERSERPTRVEHVQRVERTVNEPRAERQQVVRERPRQDDRQVRRTDRNLADGFRAIAREQRDGDNVEVRRRDGGAVTGIPNRTVERRDSDRRRWSSDWRRDHRYDWRNYRQRHRSLFQLGRYYDPYGWNYRRFSIGFSLRPSYYSSNFWLDDPWMYRLPPAYGPYRWVRYYDDALLVNIYTGQVVDVLNNFFW